MKKKIKIHFVDFWPGFYPETSIFYEILGGSDHLEISDNPEILFFSNFGNKHKEYKCFKVFFSSENERTNWFSTDLALTFDLISSSRHFRLPLYMLYSFRFDKDIRSVLSVKDNFNINEWNSRKFCCFLVSNPNAKKRIEFFNFISSKERVDSGGRYLNNLGYEVSDKIEFIRNYKFVISFENDRYDGYTTEKIFEPFLTQSIPVYWGNAKVNLDFNEKAFINVSHFKNFDAVYNRMKEIEYDLNLAQSIILCEKLIHDNEFHHLNNVKKFILEGLNNFEPISARNYNRIISVLIDKWRTMVYWIKYYSIGVNR